MLGRTLWKGPRICSPAYDLKLRLTKCVIIRRGAPGSLVIAGGGGGGMLPRISSKLRLSTASAASPWDGSVAQKKSTTFIPLCESFQVGDSGAWGRGRGAEKTKQTNKTQAASYNSSHTTTPEKVNRRYFSLFWKQEPNPKKEKRPSPLLNKTTLFYKRSPREALIRESRCATFISSILNNQSVHFDHQRHIFTHAEQHS